MDHAPRLALIELLHRDGRPLQYVDVVAWPFSMGRALDNDLVLDDPHVAAHHARLDRAEDGTVLLRLGETLNGARMGGHRLTAGESATLDAGEGAFQLGGTHLRLRLPQLPLAPERPLPATSQPAWVTGALLVVLAILTYWPAWLRTDPGRDTSEWVPMLLALPVGVALWCLLWALASKLFQHRFDFWGHLGVASRVLAPLMALDLLLPQVGASLSWPWLWQASQWLFPFTLAVLGWQHAQLVVGGRAMTLALVCLGLLVLGIAPGLVRHERQFERLNDSAYMATLPLPAWRWHRADTVEQLITDTRALESVLKARVEAARKDAAADEGDAAD